MIERVYEVIDEIDESSLKKRIDELKNIINKDEVTKKLIKKFEEAKILYERFNIKEDFIRAKKELLKNEVLKEYVELQNKINLLTLQINNRIKKLTEGVTDKK